MRVILRTVVVGVLLTGALVAQKVDERKPTVGMRARIEQLVLPGSELRARPIEDPQSPIVLRVLDVWPHGDSFRYDLEYVGLEPGTFDLAAYLERVDGTELDSLPEVAVEILAVLPPDAGEPNPLTPGELPAIGGYETLLVVAGLVWGVGLIAILFVGRRRRALAALEAAAERPLTLAERLRPRVEAAMNGALDDGGRAELERLLLSHWRARLGLQELTAAQAIAELRKHPDAGPLLLRLEEWLHAPGDPERIDVAELLRPYRDAPAQEVR